MTHRASGPFEVSLTPQVPQPGEGANPSRMLIDKRFHDDLEGTSKGQMLSVMTPIKGSAGYVAIQEVTGTLNGKRGTFILQHSATMNRGVPQLSIIVIPDSGTADLTGLTGSMNIKIDGGKHSYDFEYWLPD